MRLEVDLGFDAVPGRQPQSADNRALDLHSIAAAARSPSALRALLGREGFDEVHVTLGELPPSAVQGAALVLVALVPSRRFVLGDRSMGRAAFLVRALSCAAGALGREAGRTAWLALRVRHFSRRSYGLAQSVEHPRSVLYLRIEPTLNWMGAQVGGAATHTSGVINGLLDNGLSVDVIAPERPLGTERAHFHPTAVRRILHVVRGLTYTDYSDAILARPPGRPADFIYQRYQLGSYAGLELARRRNVPLVLEFNGSEIWVERHWGSGQLRLAGPLAELERRNLREASLVVVVSEALREQALDAGVSPDRLLVNPNGVDIDALAEIRALSPKRWRRECGLPETPTVGFIGTFGLWHGVRLLPALAAAVPEAHWVVIGAGTLFEEVRAEVRVRGLEHRVLFTGILERSRALQMLGACDVCVSPHVPNPDGSPFFGSPTKVFEYMGLAKPIVASELDQISEVLEHEQSALLTAPGDVGEAASAVRRLLGDVDLRADLGAAALARARERYSWNAHVRRILDALRAGATVAP